MKTREATKINNPTQRDEPDMGDPETQNKQNSSTSSLVYLEDIHIFALANLLSRTIIVVSLEMLREIQPIHLRGIYLPLLNSPNDCVKDPIVIAFHNFHFMPMVLGLDEDEIDLKTHNTKNKDYVKYNERYFHFDNVENIDSSHLNDDTYEQLYVLDDEYTSEKLNVKRKNEQFYNLLPLAYFNNFKQMKVHFLNEAEEKDSYKYVKKYLNTVVVEIALGDLDSRSDKPNEKVEILCCYLFKDTQRCKNDGLSAYLSFLNESIRVYTKPKSYSYLNTTVPSSPKVVYDPYASSTQRATVEDRPLRLTTYDENSSNYLCKEKACPKRAMDDKAKYYGYCYECFKKNCCNNAIVENANERQIRVDYKEVEPEKQPQQLASYVNNGDKSLISIEKSSRSYADLPARVNSAPSAKQTQIGIDRSTTQVMHQSPAKTNLKLCKTLNCTKLVQSSAITRNVADYCDECIRKSELAKATQERFRKPNVIEIPVHIETSSANRYSTVSAYNRPMTSSSKLYNIPTMNNSYSTTSSYNPDRYNLDSDDTYINRYRPSVNLVENLDYNAFNKEKCSYCESYYFVKAGYKSNGFCDKCSYRFKR